MSADFYGGWTCCVEQGQYGHYARKPTLLLAYGCNLPELRWGKSKPRFPQWAIEKQTDEWQVEMAYGQQQLSAVIAERDELRRMIAEFTRNCDRVQIALKGDDPPQAPTNGIPTGDAPQPPRGGKDAAAVAPAVAAANSTSPKKAGDHPPRHQRILDALAWATRMLGKDAVERNIVAWFADTSPKSSGYQNDLGAMRTAGLIEYPGAGLLSLTEEGCEQANWPETAPTRADLLNAVKAKLEPRHRRILDAVWAYHGKPVPRDTLADDIGVSASSSGFQNDLGKLRTLGLIDYPKPGQVELGRVFA